MRILLLIEILSNALHAYAQPGLEKKVNVDFNNARIEDVLRWMQEHHGIKLSYGFDNVQHTIRISAQAKNISVLDVIYEICKQGNLTFITIDSTVVFKYLNSMSSSTPKKKQVTKRIGGRDARLTSGSLDTISVVRDTTAASRHASDTLSNNYIIVESGVIHHEDLLTNNSSETSRRKVNVQSGLFIGYACDFNKFNFTQRDMATQQFDAEYNSSYCLGVYVLLSKKCFGSLSTSYATKDFYLNYNYKVLDLSDPFPIPDKTFLQLHYIEFPLSLAYKVATWKKVSLLGSWGLCPAFLLRERETATYQNSRDANTSYFLHANKSSLRSASLGVVLSYQFNRYDGIFLETGYSLMFDPVNDLAMRSNSSLLRLKTGIQYSLSSHK